MAFKKGLKVLTPLGEGSILSLQGTKAVRVAYPASNGSPTTTWAAKDCRAPAITGPDGEVKWVPCRPDRLKVGTVVFTHGREVGTITGFVGTAWAQFLHMGGRQTYSLRVRPDDPAAGGLGCASAAEIDAAVVATLKGKPLGSAETFPKLSWAPVGPKHPNPTPKPLAVGPVFGPPNTAPAAAGRGGAYYDLCKPVAADDDWYTFWDAWYAALAETHRRALGDYTGNGARSMNLALRTTKGTSPIQYLDRLDAALAHGFAPQNMTVFRAGSKRFDFSILPGDTFVDYGFGSSSVRHDFAMGWGSGVVFEVRILAGTPGAFVRKSSTHPKEDEFLIPRGARYRVVSILTKEQDPAGRGRIVCDLLGVGTPPPAADSTVVTAIKEA